MDDREISVGVAGAELLMFLRQFQDYHQLNDAELADILNACQGRIIKNILRAADNGAQDISPGYYP